MQDIELLAPAGSPEALKAAVQNGADAIYLAGSDFGARAYAYNFDKKTMKEAVEYAHIRGVKIYVTVNILMKDNEIQSLMEYIKFLYEIDIDALIVQDIGVFNLVKNIFPDFKIHASTQMTLHNKYGVKVLKDMEVDRIVLARELRVDEIKNIYNETGVELEVFVHGALCVSYSGQCLMSSFIGGRSGNRGRCAQPCRRQYELLNLNSNKSSIKNKAFYLSMRDLNTLEEIGKLIEAGVSSFKIEGRMKKPEYVASVVKSYRKAIDTYLESGNSLKDYKLQEEMEQIFNRKFTKGYLFNSSHMDLINIEKSNNRGLYLGKVEEFNRRENKAKTKLQVNIANGDGIEVWNKACEDIGGIVRNIYINNKIVKEAKKGQVVEIEIKGNIEKGDKVYKTLNASLMNDLKQTYAYDREYKKIFINGEIKIDIGENMKLHLWDEKGHIVYVESNNIVEKAKKISITEDKVLQQLSKLGNTPFKLNNLNINLEENSSVAISSLNSLRRDGVEKLLDLRKNTNKRKPIKEKDFLAKLESLLLVHNKQNKKLIKTQKLSVKVNTLEQLKTVLNYKINRIYYGDPSSFKDAILLCKDKNIEIYFTSPSILRNSEYVELENLLKELNFHGILAGDLGIINFNKDHWKLAVKLDSSLNVMNSYTIKALEELGVNGLTLSPELDFKNIYRLNLDNKLEKEAIVYGKMNVMISEYCPLIHENQCNHKCQQCNYPKYKYNFGLKDIKNMIFPLGKDYWARSIILNSKPLFMLDKLNDFKNVNVDWLRLEFTDEDVEEIENIVSLALKNIKIIKEDGILVNGEKDTDKLKDGFTRGHYYRGVE